MQGAKHLLFIRDMTKQQLVDILDQAKVYKTAMLNGKKMFEDAKGKTVATLFYENSTRTRVSFELAAKYLGATTVDLAVGTSSVNKGESLLDTVLTLQALQTDAVVIRHQIASTPLYLAQSSGVSVINAGDGCNEHPTQALLDLFTMRERFGELSGQKIAIIGDIQHSRVARSNIWALNKFGIKPYVYGPKTLMPRGVEELDVIVCESLNEAIKDADAVMTLRIQLERQEKGMFPSVGEYAKFYGINSENMKLANPGAIVMHPAPINRNVEISSQCADGEQSVINEQVFSGLCVRMAILKLLLNKGE